METGNVSEVFNCSKLPLLFDDFFSNEQLTNENKQEIRVNSYFYSKFSISFLVILAKNNTDAKEALINSLMEELIIHTNSFYRTKKFLDYDEIKSKLYVSTLKAIEIYDYQKGDFMHLLRRMYAIALKFYAKEKALVHMRIEKYYGEKINDFNLAEYIQPYSLVKESMKDDIQYKIDINNYIEKLSKLNQLLLLFYQQGYTFKDFL